MKFDLMKGREMIPESFGKWGIGWHVEVLFSLIGIMTNKRRFVESCTLIKVWTRATNKILLLFFNAGSGN
jgi:hypothetical protein